MTVSLAELRSRVDDALAVVQAAADIADVQEALKQAGVASARLRLTEAVAGLADTQARKRQADTAERAAKEALDDAVVAAEWELDGHFVTESNKTYCVIGDTRKAMTADERKQWKQTEARKDPAVASAAKVLRDCEFHSAEARDGLVVADKRLGACRADLDAAVAVLNALATALPAQRKAEK